MPQPKRNRSDQDLTPDALAPAPGEEQEGLVLVGILGDSTVADNVRLFLDVDFRKYYDIPRDAITKRESLPADRSPLGVDASAVWVAKGTKLVLHQSETRNVEDEFLAGDFTAPGSFTPVEGPAIPRPGPAPRTLDTVCTQVNCPTRLLGCGSRLACPPRTLDCPETQLGCPNTLAGCPRPTIVSCPSVSVRCPISQVQVCVSNLRCPTRGITCDTAICPSVARPCQSLLRCPSFGRCPSIAGCPSDFCEPEGGGFDPGDF
jgi:hypothetical protein